MPVNVGTTLSHALPFQHNLVKKVREQLKKLSWRWTFHFSKLIWWWDWKHRLQNQTITSGGAGLAEPPNTKTHVHSGDAGQASLEGPASHTLVSLSSEQVFTSGSGDLLWT